MNSLFWFKNDLRLLDNPGLKHAIENSKTISAVYIFDTSNPHEIQGAAAWWLHHSLLALSESLAKNGINFKVLKGDPSKLIPDLISELNSSALFFSRCYTPHDIEQQNDIHQYCNKNQIECKRFAGSYLSEPEAILNKQDSPYKVFTPYYKCCIKFGVRPASAPLTHNKKTKKLETKPEQIHALGLLPSEPNWAKGFEPQWQPGETNALEALDIAIDDIISRYSESRDLPAEIGTSRLSPYLRFGEISPSFIWEKICESLGFSQAEPYLRQLIWRDFNAYLLFHFPHILSKAFNQKFSKFKWRSNKKHLRAWQQGLTGYPLVDAAMRELWHNGWMHNRCRMVTASFLTKHLHIDWREGAQWFWDTLLDADLANNTGGWQWVAGCGADAAPYFRIFNPTTQAEKFDKQGHYIRQWLPELSKLPNKYIHSPWTAPESILKEAGISLGVQYPAPIVDHKTEREHALSLYKSLS